MIAAMGEIGKGKGEDRLRQSNMNLTGWTVVWLSGKPRMD